MITLLVRSLLLVFVTSVVNAQDNTSDFTEAYATGWAFHLDNDLFADSSSDKDYTGGIALNLSGARATQYVFSVDKLRRGLDKIIGFDRLFQNTDHFKLHAIEYGFVLFTPSDIESAVPLYNDHPYASLFFLVNNAQIIVPESKMSWHSSLTVGLLGLDLAEDLQGGIHKITGSVQPEGWRYQISSGGEPTLRYSLGSQKTVVDNRWTGNWGYEFKLGTEFNLGFSTDMGLGFNGRVGRIAAPWWSFNPHQAEYVSLGSPAQLGDQASGERDFYFYIGGMIKWRIYNSVLQGQFRHSEVSFDRDELEDLVGDLWAGINYELSNNTKLSFFVRTRTAELSAPGSRKPVWGGLLFSRSY